MIEPLPAGPSPFDLASEAPVTEDEARYVKAARAANTLRGCRSDWTELAAWADQCHVPACPARSAELEEARVALVDALAKLARAPKNPIENSTCIVLLAEAFDLLPPPIGTMGGSGRGVPPTPPTTPAPPSLGHSHGA